ncbi:MAG: hypothetical protein A3C88_01810 [Candidatus Yanofskybacteria bacterium RIFCSPHIGHO2_02_FULL_50_12]|uniref:Ribulose-phosphate 3-epimerase n=1 Tax=Candidatus Yanofskybacteria bacterium RIFCSPHIGHO2_02_FULL_50_12 TaxID=1802685 RepID=A0A1F8FVS1_9BACT|nr:MAG: hypothetical protein A3C88_01810 [Candidatus Yanofskybacteria bacterium RIFCSPHIGHO2_02_FULL_50_12]
MIEVVPAILAKTKEELESAIKKIESHAERVHLDVLDGAFTGANKSIHYYEELEAIEIKLKLDIHLMVTYPQEIVPQWLMNPNADRFWIHVESQGNLADLCLEIRGQGRKVGMVINPETLSGTVLEYLPMIDYIQFMTVHPGSYGRPFLTDMLDKISTFHESHPDLIIAVDGGINPETVHMVHGAGAEIAVSGSYIMNSPDPAKALTELKDGFQ